MEIVATTSLPAVNHPNADRWNAARSCQKLEGSEKRKKCKPAPSKNVPRKSNLKINNKHDQAFCSICSLVIHDYIPEYFSGEKFNPACDSCKANDSSWDPNDPFSSFPSPEQPVSMVSHWLLPSTRCVPPGLVTWLVAHRVQHDMETEKLVSREEFLKLFEEFREQLGPNCVSIS